jgi:hypothetical protein
VSAEGRSAERRATISMTASESSGTYSDFQYARSIPRGKNGSKADCTNENGIGCEMSARGAESSRRGCSCRMPSSGSPA